MPPVLFKDILVEIRRSLGRFFSIMLIVALGVAFFAGIKASPPDMKASADDYFDRYGLQDLQVFSTIGLDDDDLEAMRQIPGVEAVQGLFNQDVIVRLGNSEQVWKVFSLPKQSEMNQLRIEEGRLPEKAGECFIEGGGVEAGLHGTYAIGDTITLESGTDDPLSDTLKQTTFTVVGRGYTPRYLSYEKGTSSIGSGSVDGFLFIPEEDIKADYWTEADITVSGAAAVNAYEDAYFDITDPVLKDLEALGKTRVSDRLDKIRSQISDGEKTLKEETAKGKAELEEGRVQVQDAQAQVESGSQELANGRSQLDTGWSQLNTGQAQIDASQAQIDAGLQQVQQAQAKKPELESALAQLSDGLAQAEALRQQAVDGLAQIEAGLQQTEAGLSQIDQAALESQKSQLETAIAGLQAAIEAGGDGETLKQQLASLQASLAQVQSGLDTLASLQQTKTQLEAQKQQAADGLAQAEAAITGLEARKKQVTEGLAQIESAEAALPSLQAGQAQVDAGRQQLEASRAQLQAKEAEYADGVRELEAGRASLEQARAQLAEGEQQLAAQTAKAEKQLEDARSSLKDLENMDPEWIVLDRDSFYSYRDYESCADRMDGIASVFPVFFFLVAALVCMTTMTRMVDEQRSQIGTLKALGYSRAQIAMKYILYSLAASLLGSVIGCAVGMVVFPYIIFYAWNTMYTIDTIRTVWQPGLMVLAGASVTLVILATTLYSIARELREVPSQLMRPRAGVAGKKILLERIPSLWRRIPFLHKVTIRNIFRYKKRFFMTVIGISGCSALLVAGFGINDSISSIVSEQFGRIYQYDAAVTADSADLDKELSGLQGVSGVYLEQDLPVTLEIGGGDISCTVHVAKDPGLRDFVHLDSLQGKALDIPEEGALISQKMAEKMGLSEGSEFTMKTADDHKITTKVAGIFTQYVGHQVYVSEKTFTSWDLDETPSDVYLLKTSDQSSGFEDALGQDIMALNDVRSVSFYSKLQQNFLDMIGSIKMVVVVLLISAAMLAFVVLYNLANVNISERVREIATIKVLGYTDREVDAYVNRESMILAVIGGAVGLVLGIWLHRLIMNLAELDDIMFGRFISPLSFAVAFALTIVFAAAVNFVMRFRLKKVEMVESLKAVE